MKPRRQLRWWKSGGFRLPWLARLTGGRVGLGRWTQPEIDEIRRRAREHVRLMEEYYE